MVDALVAIIESRGRKHKPVAEEAWPYKKAAYRTWQDMRNGTSPQKLTIRDAYRMARVLGITMSALCGLVEGQMLAAGIAQGIEAAPLKNEAPQIEAGETDDTAGSTPPARKPGGGVQSFLGGSS